MTKSLIFPAFFAALFMLSGCDGTQDPPTSDFTLTFKATYDGQALEKYKNYPYNTYTVQFSRFNAFMSDITLLKGTEEVRLTDIAWVDFTPDQATNNLAVEVPLKFYNIPEGTYTGIRMGYGVRPDLNAKQPKDFAPSHPLSRENEYWLGWKSYIFNKIEGTVDLNNNNIPDGGLVYHCGSDAVYREYTFNTPITVSQAGSATVEFDLKKLFTINGAWYDISTAYNQVTSNDVNDIVVATILMDNFDFATSVKQ